LNVAERHDMIRSIYPKDELTYHILPMSPQLLDEMFHATHGHASVEDAVAAGVTLVGAAVTLDEQPPLRFWVGVVDETSSVLLIAGHHLVFDAWSFMLFYEDLASEYRRVRGNGPERTRPTQYHDVRAEVGTSAVEGWSDLFERPYPAIRELQGRATDAKGPAAVLRRSWPDRGAIAAAAKSHRVTPYVLGAAALLRAMSDTFGTAQVIAGSAYAGRITAASAEVIGYFSTTLFFGADLDAGWDTSELIRQVNGQLRRWYAMPRVQWEPLLDRYHATDLYPVKFAFLPINLASPVPVLDGLSIERLSPPPAASARRPIDLISAYRRGTVVARLIHRLDAVDDGLAGRLLDDFGKSLDDICRRAAAGDSG
ncbi:MAG: hypothetical protein QOI74_3949, partial [Micromonosporaceae bacterium]|nr:hypothetical protein [Micromonosporaceae bacterium]